jgi:hypothetical protein
MSNPAYLSRIAAARSSRPATTSQDAYAQVDRMAASTNASLVANGGWKATRSLRIKPCACVALGAAITIGVVAACWFATMLLVPAAPCLIASVALFVRERPVAFEIFSGRAGADPHKLHGRH